MNLLKTDRFYLTEIIADDQEFIFEGLSNPQVISHYGISFSKFEESVAQMLFYESLENDGTGKWWKIVDSATGEKVGAIGHNNYQPRHKKTEIGYWLLPAFWKKGIISEMLPILIAYLQTELEVHRIEALVEEGNEASCNTLQKAGFFCEGTMKDWEIKNDRYINMKLFSLINS